MADPSGVSTLNKEWAVLPFNGMWYAVWLNQPPGIQEFATQLECVDWIQSQEGI